MEKNELQPQINRKVSELQMPEPMTAERSDKITPDRPLSSGARKCTTHKRWGGGRNTFPPLRISRDTSDFHLRT
ncbi:hypothetical protein CEXT_564221 [Caerostris extrusa]|uniref:Uncharacterized protein n=1 Tax=Caerostris extrusa TaxID=172846 RepID=A0AAV4M3A3_CAEEX|nr:hypothetical protein CEXT_564221 [Caerostris extrusa]